MALAQNMCMFHFPTLRVGSYNPQPEYLFIKRAFDIVASGVALIVLSPIMLITAAAIKFADGGSVLYKQERLTKNGRRFSVLIFRSMRVDAERDGVARLSTCDKGDKITPARCFIRKVRIDELPQLINILNSTMSICSPRPERPDIAKQYCKEML